MFSWNSPENVSIFSSHYGIAVRCSTRNWEFRTVVLNHLCQFLNENIDDIGECNAHKTLVYCSTTTNGCIHIRNLILCMFGCVFVGYFFIWLDISYNFIHFHISEEVLELFKEFDFSLIHHGVVSMSLRTQYEYLYFTASASNGFNNSNDKKSQQPIDSWCICICGMRMT